ncbi:MAG TPA: dihydroorotate dehydrogenase electron transfer subunit [Sedimentisphaerales bacterium]|nr:dihydroorotate dehydrogenase electron transfer subunit [Sedimentisphaerales bacterium]
MSEEYPSSAKGVFEAIVSSNKHIGHRFYKLRLEFSGAGARAFADFSPGQFAELDLSGTALPPAEAIPDDLHDAAGRKILLRRPFSFTDVTAERNKTFADLLYCVVGPATLRTTTLSSGDSLSVIGPLGNGFSVPEGKKTALLIVGGMGVPPLLHLAKHLTADSQAKRIEVIAFAGAKTAKELPFEGQLDEISQQLGFSIPEFARYGIESLVATDDGSAGYHGFVTDCLAEWLGQSDLAARDTIIYACGPQAMLSRMAELAKEKNIDCQLSMERRMACGIGLCQSCAIECRVEGSNETVYKMCCKDGPVFDGKEVVF